jgi:glycine/D-amino acid oxidase-like deaminating enzyme
MSQLVVAGAGIFGVTAAIELARRGHQVRLFDRDPIPHPQAESTDISKIVRMEYGPDEQYAEWGERSLEGWRKWNRELGEELFHETGVMFLRQSPLQRATFEGDSLAVLEKRGFSLQRLDSGEIARRFPAWNSERYVDGIFNPVGGWVESGRVVSKLVAAAIDLGVEVCEGEAPEEGDLIQTTGAWTRAPWLRPNAMPVFHLQPRERSLFEAERFPVFGADISRTGWYGFPLHPKAGVVKIANHGRGRSIDPSSSREVSSAEIGELRTFLAETFPFLADAPVVWSRLCVYGDTYDGHFWIAPDPARPNRVVATGGSGHAFKFAPLLGGWIADAFEGRVIPRFRWRPELRPARSEEAARKQS